MRYNTNAMLPTDNQETTGISEQISVIIADDHPLIRQALRSVLEKEPDLRIIAEASNGEEVVRLATQLVPKVVIMDISMPKLNGLEATRRIKVKCPEIAILVLTVYDDKEHILGILDAGAAGYLVKNVFGKEVIQAIRGVALGDTVLSSVVLKRLVREPSRYYLKPVLLSAHERISGREREILRLAALGLSNKDIAAKLQISLPTVKSYLAEIFSKLNVGNRTEAVITSIQAGIIAMTELE